jgi:hypothetical protein
MVKTSFIVLKSVQQTGISLSQACPRVIAQRRFGLWLVVFGARLKVPYGVVEALLFVHCAPLSRLWQ